MGNQKENCENVYVPYDVPGYGRGYYECVVEDNKCKPKRSVGEDGISKDVYNFCSDVCLAVSASTLTNKGEACNAQPTATNPRILSQTECESSSRDVTLPGDAQNTIYPCIWQGAVNGVNNSNCHPDYNPPTAACHCVSGSEPCIDQAPWLCSGTPAICEQMALDDGLRFSGRSPPRCLLGRCIRKDRVDVSAKILRRVKRFPHFSATASSSPLRQVTTLLGLDAGCIGSFFTLRTVA